jgi:hypothetical protein
MRKRIVAPAPATAHSRGDWLDLERAATVEVTSEDKDFPFESSLSIEPSEGWRAAQPGAQTIRLVFDEPQELKRISLVFEKNEMTQRVSITSLIQSWRALSRDCASAMEFQCAYVNASEDYCVELSDVITLELTIVPNISGGAARASLKRLRLS